MVVLLAAVTRVVMVVLIECGNGGTCRKRCASKRLGWDSEGLQGFKGGTVGPGLMIVMGERGFAWKEMTFTVVIAGNRLAGFCGHRRAGLREGQLHLLRAILALALQALWWGRLRRL